MTMEQRAHSAKVTAGEVQCLALEKREAVLERVKSRFSHIPSEVSLADELMADRRAEASTPLELVGEAL